MKTKKDTLIKSYREHFKLFCKYLKKNRKKPTMEGIHQLRVQVKRLRAILEVIELTSLGAFHKRKHFNHLRPLFKKAGVVRELQINLKLIKKLPKNQVRGFKKHLLKQLQSSKKTLRITTQKFDLKKLKKLNQQLYRKYIVFQNKKYTTEYLESKINAIHQIKNQKLTTHQLHQIRRLIKSIKEILKMHTSDLDPQDFNLSVDSLQEIETDLGNWHDAVVLLEFMNKYNLKAKKNQTKKLRPAIKSVKRKIKKLKSEILEDLKRF